VEDITSCLEQFGHPITRIGFEAGTMSQTLFHGLKAAGYDVVCMEARQVYAALSAMRNKTDKNDARGIAQVLRSGWYNKVHIKSNDAHYDRALLTARKTVLRKCLDHKFLLRFPAFIGEPEFRRSITSVFSTEHGPAHHLQ